MRTTLACCYDTVDYSPRTRWDVVEHLESFGLEVLDPYLPEPIMRDDTVVYAVVPVPERTMKILADHMIGRARNTCRSNDAFWRRPVLRSGPAFRIETALPMWDAYFDYFYTLLRDEKMCALVCESDDPNSLELSSLHDPSRYVLNNLFGWSKIIWTPIHPKIGLFAYKNTYVPDVLIPSSSGQRAEAPRCFEV